MKNRPLLLILGLVLLAPIARAQTPQTPRYELNEQGEFVPIQTPDPDTPEGKLAMIRQELVEGSASRAVSKADDWLEANPGHPLEVEAYLIRGDAKFAAGNEYIALADYEAVIGLFPGTEQYRTAISREYDIANLYIGGVRRKSRLLGIRMWPSDDIGVELLIRIQERMPGSPIGEKASIGIGDYYFNKGDMELATEAYDLFLINYPGSRQREWAILRLIQASLARFKGPEFDPTGLTEAAQRLQQYKSEFPAAAERIGADALLIRITESLASKDLATAKWHDERGLDYSAVVLYRRLVIEFPQTQAARAALERLVDMDQELIDPRAPGYDPRRATPTKPDDIEAQIRGGE